MRERGYYWVVFPYQDRTWRWEPAGWDPTSNHGQGMWAMIGSKDVWFDFQLAAVGPRIQPPYLSMPSEDDWRDRFIAGMKQ